MSMDTTLEFPEPNDKAQSPAKPVKKRKSTVSSKTPNDKPPVGAAALLARIKAQQAERAQQAQQDSVRTPVNDTNVIYAAKAKTCLENFSPLPELVAWKTVVSDLYSGFAEIDVTSLSAEDWKEYRFLMDWARKLQAVLDRLPENASAIAQVNALGKLRQLDSFPHAYLKRIPGLSRRDRAPLPLKIDYSIILYNGSDLS